MKEQGITLGFASFDEVTVVQRRNTDSWPLMNPMFDPGLADIPLSENFCLVGRNPAGRIIATCSGKYLDATARSFSEIVNAGDFFSVRPDANTAKYAAHMTSSLADQMHGRLAYSGGLWMHPDVRGVKLPALFCRLVTATMLTLWNPDLVLGLLDYKLAGTNYHKRYGYTHDEPMLTFTGNGEVLLEAVLLWMTAGDTAEDLARFLDAVWPQIDAAVVAGHRQYSA